jgi:hypothetical protein
MSPHGLVQEYLNLTEHLYGIVSNGRLIRLLRDSSRLVKLTFIEFDLERIFTEELFADFALFYRLLFLMVIKERGLAHVPGTDKRLREIYDLGYSLARLRRLAEKPNDR